MNVYLSVETECKFCNWKIKEGQGPLFGTTKAGRVYAFCPVCNLELEISTQEIDGPEPSEFIKMCKDIKEGRYEN